MKVKQITCDEESEVALKRLDAIWNEDTNERYLLALVIADYERRSVKIDPPRPGEALRFRMEQQDMSVEEFAMWADMEIGTLKHVLEGNLDLFGDEIRRLYKLGIPAESLVGNNRYGKEE